MGKRMDDWLRNMGDWNISRRRYYGLPLPFYPCECGHLNVIGSKAELRGARDSAARPAGGAAPALDRRGADHLRAVRRGGAPDPRGRRRLARRRHRPLLDARLAEPGVRPGGLRDRRSQGPDEGRPARPRLLGAVVPGRLGLGDARADPALVLLAALHVGRRSPGGRRTGRCSATRRCSTRPAARCTGSWGNTIEAGEAFERMGADVMRWQYCAQPPEPEPALRLRARARDQAQAADALELGQVLRRLREHRGLPADVGRAAEAQRAAAARPLARSTARTRSSARRPRRYEAYLTVDVDPRLRGVRRRSLELVHPPLAAALLGRRPRRAARALARRSCSRCASSRR